MDTDQTMAGDTEIVPPSRRALLRVGAAALAIAGTVLAAGIAVRVHDGRHVAAWTADQAIPTVALAKLESGKAAGMLTLPGNVQPFNKAAIYARVSGYLKSWSQDIGAHVTAGQQLALIDTPDLDQQLDQAKADLASAEVSAQLAAVTAKRWGELVKPQYVTQQAADEKTVDAATKASLRDASAANVRRLEAMEDFKSIVAPFAGIVTARKTDIGALINAGSSAGQELFEVSDMSKVRIYVQVPQAFAADLKPGETATFEMPQYPGRQFTATLVTTSNALVSGSASMLAELQADNADGALQAGAYCQVHFQLPGHAQLVRVPATALAPTDRGVEVAVLGDDGHVTFKPVQLGRDFGDTVEITSGISPSDRLVDNPPETLESGDAVRLAVPRQTLPQPPVSNGEKS